MVPLIEPGDELRRLFDGLVEQAFMVELGICDPRLTAYLGGLLASHVHIDQIYRLRSVDSHVIREISELEANADLGPEVDAFARRRIINQYIGDLTLFWAGLYPEALRPRHSGGIDRLSAYVASGKRSYGIASDLTRAGQQPPPDVLLQLSEQFEYCVHGLHLVRAGWESLARGDGDN